MKAFYYLAKSSQSYTILIFKGGKAQNGSYFCRYVDFLLMGIPKKLRGAYVYQ